VRIDPNNFEAYVNSGAILAQMKHYPAAERMFRSALAIRKDSPEAWNNLGVTLQAQGRTAEAAWSFEQGRRAGVK
jgi:Flp pilus assembly protein TadD